MPAELTIVSFSPIYLHKFNISNLFPCPYYTIHPYATTSFLASSHSRVPLRLTICSSLMTLPQFIFFCCVSSQIFSSPGFDSLSLSVFGISLRKCMDFGILKSGSFFLQCSIMASWLIWPQHQSQPTAWHSRVHKRTRHILSPSSPPALAPSYNYPVLQSTVNWSLALRLL